MCVVTGLYGVLVVLLGIAEQLWVAYAAFVVYHAAFELMAPVASAEVCCRLCVCVGPALTRACRWPDAC